MISEDHLKFVDQHRKNLPKRGMTNNQGKFVEFFLENKEARQIMSMIGGSYVDLFIELRKFCKENPIKEDDMHEFYVISNGSFETKIKLIDDAKNLCKKWWVDKLDCSVSWSRETIQMSYEDIMKKFTNNCHFVFIMRNPVNPKDKPYIEVGFTTLENIPHYLWIEIDAKHLQHFIDEYKLVRK